ncbi:MAG: T9SS type A sorting domain-containing protein [Flavobacteriales bacterium]|nr:T9SS type A sorting domain-containing protein [Flavobacteriales bacterium]
MLRFYFMLGLSGLVATASAQQLDRGSFSRLPAHLATEKFNIAPANAVNKAPGDELWRDDFDTPGDWTIDNASEPTSGWFITDNSTGTLGWPSFIINGMASSSGGNYAELYNGDPTTGSPAPANATLTLTSEVINLTMAGVDLLFEQEGAQFLDMQEVYVTVDAGASWVLVGDNLDMGVLSSAGGSAYPEPHTKKLDLGAALSAAGFSAPANIQLRFQWAPGSQNIAYGWLIDDVRITEKEGNDLALSDAQWFHNTFSTIIYTKVPTSQWAPMTFTGNIFNKGSFDQPNTTLTVAITGAGTGTATNVPYLAASSSLVLAEATSFTPSSVGTYNAIYTLISDSADSDLSNNGASLSWDGTVFEYGKDLDAFDGWYGPFDDDGDLIDDPFELISEFEINNATTFTGMRVVFHAGEGEEVYYNIYSLDATGGFVPEFDGLTVPIPTYTIVAADISLTAGSEVWVALPFPLDVVADPSISDSYFAVCGYNLINDPANAVEFAVSGETLDTTNFLTVFATTAGETNYFVQDVPMFRLSEDPSIGISEADFNSVALGQNMPNPFNANTIIPFSLLNNATIEFTVTDMMGKIVERQELGTLSAGDHTIDFEAGQLAGGLYYYTVTANGKSTTKKMSVAK